MQFPVHTDICGTLSSNPLIQRIIKQNTIHFVIEYFVMVFSISAGKILTINLNYISTALECL